MNWKRTILCALGTALLVTGGFLLPKAVFAYQDYRFDQADATTLTQPFQVQTTSQLSQSLLLAGNLNDNVTLETSQAQRSKKEVKTLATDALTLLNTCYQDILNLDKLTNFTATPLLTVSTGSDSTMTIQATGGTITDADTTETTLDPAGLGSGFSAIVWDCTFSTQDGGIRCILDDRSGKLLALDYYCSDTLKKYAETYAKQAKQMDFDSLLRADLVLFFTKYYEPDGIEVRNCEELGLDKEKGEDIYGMRLRFSGNDTVLLPLTLTWDHITFNCSES